MSVNEAKTDRRQLRDYLLGRLPEDLAVQFDSRLFADDALRQELDEEQHSLIEDFVCHRLTETEERTFREQCTRSPLLREKVGALRVLLSALERQQDSTPASFSLSLKQFLTLLSPALALLLCFAAFLYARERHRNTAQISQVAAPVPPSKLGAPSSGHGVPTVVAFLSANVVRSPSAMPKIKIPSAGTTLELQVEVRSPSSSVADWDVALLRGDEVIQSSSHVPLHRLGEETYLSLTIDAASIHDGPYRVRYSPHGDPGVPQYRSFQGVN
jgi:hypothetical protein